MAAGYQIMFVHLQHASKENNFALLVATVDAIEEALQDDNVVAGLAKRSASVVMETIATRLNAMDKSLRDKDDKIKQLEEHVKRVDAQNRSYGTVQ